MVTLPAGDICGLIHALSLRVTGCLDINLHQSRCNMSTPGLMDLDAPLFIAQLLGCCL